MICAVSHARNRRDVKWGGGDKPTSRVASTAVRARPWAAVTGKHVFDIFSDRATTELALFLHRQAFLPISSNEFSLTHKEQLEV